LRVKLKRIKTLIKRQKSKEQMQKKKKHYKLELKCETKNNEIFIKDSRKKIKDHKNKYQILNIKI
jgi:hypothetical protein